MKTHITESRRKRAWIFICLLLTMVLVGAGCSNSNSSPAPTPSEPTGTTTEPGQEQASPEEPVEIRIVRGPLDEVPPMDHRVTQHVIAQTNILPKLETFPWGGGNDYVQGLQLMFAAGDFPDVFRPWGGIEQTLIQQGEALALDELLPEYAPTLWALYPEEIWDLVRSASEDGKIYFIPQVMVDLAERNNIIRGDWLDAVNLEVPTTKEELVEVLRAFRQAFPNAHPTSGRELGRWMDGMFAMHGVAMWEGFPEWDVYNGEITYAGVTDNMRASIAFLRDLYAEGLLDPETFLNSGDAWRAKIQNNQVGFWYHLPSQLADHSLNSLRENVPEAYYKAVPLPKADGFEGFLTRKQMGNVEWMIPKAAEAKAPYVLQYIEFWMSKEGKEFLQYGFEGDNWERTAAGVIEVDLDKADAQEMSFRYALAMNPSGAWDDANREFHRAVYPGDVAEMIISMNDQGVLDSKPIASDGMPSSLYEGYPDIQSHRLYQEYMTKIIIGEWDISRFDEFVDRWYSSGGTEVTERVREWHSRVYQ